MDEDGGGCVRFDEFCAWCARKSISASDGAEAEAAAPQFDTMYYVSVDEDGNEMASDEVAVSDVRTLISTGAVTAETSVWAEGMDGGWLPLRECAAAFGLTDALGPHLPPPLPPLHELEPAEGGPRAAIMEMVPLFDQTKKFLRRVDTNDRSTPDLSAVDRLAQQPTILNSRPRGESWVAPSPNAASPLSPVRARLMAGKYASPLSALNAAESSSSESDSDDGLIIGRPRGASWGAAPKQQEQREQQQASRARAEERRKKTPDIAEQGQSDTSDDDAADGLSTPDFASLQDEPSAMSPEGLEERWRAMGGSDRALIQIRQNLRGASYNKGGQDPRKLFQSYDRDNSGDIDRWEFRQAVRKGGRITPVMMTDDDLERLFECVDVDGDGELSIDEMIEMIWGKDMGRGSSQKGKRQSVTDKYLSQAKRMTDDAKFDALHEYYLDTQITAQRAPPKAQMLRSVLAKNDFGVLCGKLEAKYGIHPLVLYNER